VHGARTSLRRCTKGAIHAGSAISFSFGTPHYDGQANQWKRALAALGEALQCAMVHAGVAVADQSMLQRINVRFLRCHADHWQQGELMKAF
jgi:hypothetical protein